MRTSESSSPFLGPLRKRFSPSIAGPNRSKLTEIADAKCRLIEDYSFLGSLFRHSILPNSIKDQMAAQSFIQNISSKITACKSKGDFQKTIDKYNRAYKSYEAKLLALVKLLIKQSPAETFKFMAACIRGNMDKIRLGSMLQQATLNSFASASFSLTFYDILLELVKPVLAKPELMAKADPDFFYSLKQEFRYSDVDPIKTEGSSPLTSRLASDRSCEQRVRHGDKVLLLCTRVCQTPLRPDNERNPASLQRLPTDGGKS